MSRFLSVDADAHGLFVVSATVRGGAVVVERALARADDAAPLSAATAADAGKHLKEMLAAAGVKPAPVLVCVGRDRVVLKDVRHPPAPPQQEPAVVRFQAVRDLAESPDDLLMDYAPTGTAPDGDRKALAVFVRKDIVAAARVMCDAAGLKLAAVTPRPFALAAAVAHAVKAGTAPAAADPAEPVAVVGLWDRGGEFAVVRGGEILLARSVSAAALASDHALTAELKRNLAVFAGQPGAAPVGALYVAGPGGDGLLTRLRATLPVQVFGFDPVTDDAVPAPLRGRFVGPAGLLALRAAAATLPINFAAPRQPKAEPGKARARVLLGALAAVLLVGMVGLVAVLEIDKADQAVADRENKKQALDEQLARFELDAKRLAAVDEFEARGVSVPDELYELTGKVTDVTKVRVTEVDLTAKPPPKVTARPGTPAQGQPQQTVAAAKAAPVPAAEMAVIYRTGDAKLSQDLGDAYATKNDAYYVGSRTVRVSQGEAGAGRSDQQSYKMTAEVVHRGPSKYTRQLREKPPAAAAGDDGDGTGFGGGFGP